MAMYFVPVSELLCKRDSGPRNTLRRSTTLYTVNKLYESKIIFFTLFYQKNKISIRKLIILPQ